MRPCARRQQHTGWERDAQPKDLAVDSLSGGSIGMGASHEPHAPFCRTLTHAGKTGGHRSGHEVYTSDFHVEVIDLLGNKVQAELGVAFFAECPADGEIEDFTGYCQVSENRLAVHQDDGLEPCCEPSMLGVSGPILLNLTVPSYGPNSLT